MSTGTYQAVGVPGPNRPKRVGDRMLFLHYCVPSKIDTVSKTNPNFAISSRVRRLLLLTQLP
jgi:hypothetical protein